MQLKRTDTAELGDGYASALTNFGFIASAMLTAEETVAALSW